MSTKIDRIVEASFARKVGDINKEVDKSHNNMNTINSLMFDFRDKWGDIHRSGGTKQLMAMNKVLEQLIKDIRKSKSKL